MEQEKSAPNMGAYTSEELSNIEKAYDAVEEDLDALEKTLEDQPTNEKIKKYVELNYKVLDNILESLDDKPSEEASRTLGRAATNHVVDTPVSVGNDTDTNTDGNRVFVSGNSFVGTDSSIKNASSNDNWVSNSESAEGGSGIGNAVNE